jgi:O-antigen/teichoic acid export membrane protein
MSIARKSTQTLLAHLLVYAMGLVLTPIVIKVSGTEAYGGYVLVVSYLGIIFGISSLGFGVSARRWLPSCDSPTDRARIFYPQLFFQLGIVLLLSILSMLAYIIGNSKGWFNLAGFSAWIIPNYLMTYVLYSQTTDYFRYTHRVEIFNIAIVTQPFLFLTFSLLVYYFAGIINPGTLILSLTIASLLVAIPQLWKLHTEIGLRFCFPKTGEILAELRIGFPLMLSYVVDVILGSGDRYIIAAILSVRDVGTYVPAYALGSLIIVLPKVFGVVLPPLLSQRVDASDTAGAQRIIRGAIRIFLLISIPFVVGALVLGEQVLRLYANEDVSKVASPIVPLVAMGSIYYGLILINANILFVRLRTGLLFRINVIAAILNVVLNIVLLELFKDVVMAAFATLLSYAVSYVWLSRRMIGDEIAVRIDIGWLFMVIAASVIMGVVVLISLKAVPMRGIASVGVGMAIGCLTYGLALFGLKIADDEFCMMRRLVTWT